MDIASHAGFSWYDAETGIEYVIVGEPGEYKLSMNGQGHLPITDDDAVFIVETHQEPAHDEKI